LAIWGKYSRDVENRGCRGKEWEMLRESICSLSML
jgi:hypothetical protein